MITLPELHTLYGFLLLILGNTEESRFWSLVSYVLGMVMFLGAFLGK